MVASMGDIAFLLITFFVLIHKVSQEDHVRMTLPQSYDVEDFKEKAAVRITIDGDQKVMVNGMFIPRDQLRQAIIAELGDPAAAPAAPATPVAPTALAGPPAPAAPVEQRWDRMVLLRFDKDTNHSMYFPILELLAEFDAQVAMVAEEAPKHDPTSTPPPTGPAPGGAHE
jgi:hypothetical protein